MSSENAQIRIIASMPLAEDWGKLTKYTFDYRRHDGEWQRQTREVYDRGNGAVILLYNRRKRSVILTRQFRLPLFVNQHHGFLLEAAAGLLDELEPEERIRHEAEEETGYRLEQVQKVFVAWMSPGSVSEKLHFFIAEYDDSKRTGSGGGVIEEERILKWWRWILPPRWRQSVRAILPTAKPLCYCNIWRWKAFYSPAAPLLIRPNWPDSYILSSSFFRSLLFCESLLRSAQSLRRRLASSCKCLRNTWSTCRL